MSDGIPEQKERVDKHGNIWVTCSQCRQEIAMCTFHKCPVPEADWVPWRCPACKEVVQPTDGHSCEITTDYKFASLVLPLSAFGK